MFDLVCMVNQYWVVMEVVIGEREKNRDNGREEGRIISIDLIYRAHLLSHSFH
jgi:hypothetical protein